MKAEIGKLGNTDFDLIESVSIKITSEKSKDIRVLSFLSLCFLRKENWENFADVFEGIATLASQDYAALNPDRERAKQLAFKWISEGRFAALVAEKKPPESAYPHTLRLVNALTTLKPILEKNFPDGSPFPAELFKNAQVWEKTTKPKAPPPQAAAPAPAASAPAQVSSDSASGASQAPVSQPASASATIAAPETFDSPRQAIPIVKKAAQVMIEKEPQKIMGYRIMRILRWDLLEKAPPADSGKTQLAAPASQSRTYMINLLNQKDWKTLFDKSEATFMAGANHVWLDLQRYSYTACKELGPTYNQLADAIIAETAFFIQRIPEIVNMKFSDDTPFCDDATKDWINNTVATSKGSGSGGGGSRESADDPLKKELQSINELSAANQFDKALDLCISGKRNSGCKRDNFRRSIQIGTLLLKAKQPDLAVSVLESLHEEITTYSLDSWEPSLAVEAWATLVGAYKVAKNQKTPQIQSSLQEKQNTILSRIAQIDPKKALLLNT